MSSAAVIVDTETTGFNEPQVIQFAFAGPMSSPRPAPQEERAEVSIFRPTKPIDCGAMAAHHIIAEDLVDFPVWPGPWVPPAGVGYLVGHNADYDWKAIGQPAVGRICTLALSRSLWPEADSHSLSAMLYLLMGPKAARPLVRHAHGAMVDVNLCWRLFGFIVDKLPACTTWEDVWLASERARMPERLTFGKYGPDSDWAKASGEKGMRCADVRRLDFGYWQWLMSKCDQVRDDVYLQKALRGEAA